MYAQLFMFKTAPGKRSEAEKLADACAPLKAMNGFRRATYFGDYDNNEYGSLYIWETKEDMEAAFKEIGPRMQEATNSIVIEPPFRRLYEVYEPKT
jgi:heme-degrading monooxygenase HmoA